MMKKLLFPILALVLAVGLALPMATPAAAHTEANPRVITLYAGQDIEVGTVKVWNDGTTLYVKYETTGGWVMTETHLAVAEDLEDIPQTKTGNPKVGHFEYSEPHDPPVTSYSYPPIDVSGLGDALNIAAHAVVVDTGTVASMTVVSDVSATVTQRRSGNATGFTLVDAPAVLAWEPGPNYPNDGPDDSGWEADSLWDQRLSTDLRPTGADWIWESYRVRDPINGTVISLENTFDVNGYIASGSLLIACDNGYEAFLNEVSLGSDNVYNVYGDWRTSNLKQAFVDVNGWDAVGSYDLLDYLVAGTNVLTIDAANEYFNTDDSGNNAPGTASSNPGACIYALEVEYYPIEETAWAAGLGFDGKNWATYFEYTVQ